MGRIQLSAPYFSEMERMAVVDVIDSGWISKGPWRVMASERLKSFCKRKYCLLTSNGTMALTAAIAAVSDKTVGRVAVPAMCWPGVAQAVEQMGGYPVGVDINEFLQMDDVKLMATEAETCIAVDSYGGMGDLEAIEEVCRRKRMPMIEDAAEAFGATCNGRPAGNFGDISIFSFFANKIVTAGEGGALLTDDPSLFEAAKAYVDFGRTVPSYHSLPGTNGHITELQCAVLATQLGRADELMSKRRNLQYLYNGQFSSIFLQKYHPKTTGVPWLYSLFAKTIDQRNAILRELSACDIEARPFFPPLAEHRGLRKYVRAEEERNARMFSYIGVSLPMHPALTDDDVAEIARIIRPILSK